MEKIDARKLPSSPVEEKRRQTVKLRKKGMTRAQIGEIVGVHADTVGRWLKAYEAQGAKALKLKTRGRREGSGRRLDEDQEHKIQKLLVDKTLDQWLNRYCHVYSTSGSMTRPSIITVSV
jgi:transposase